MRDLIIMLVLGILVGFCLFGIYDSSLKYGSPLSLSEEGSEPSESEQEIINNCKNLSLEKTARCLRDNIKPFFIYNETEDDVQLTFQQLRERGGDCRDYAKYYEKMGEQLGFSSYSFHIAHNDRGHRFAVIANEEGFCILNLLRIDCIKNAR